MLASYNVTTEPVAPYLWLNLPLTDAILKESAIAPLEDPSASIAERLVILAHKHFNSSEWSSSRSSMRIARYWGALQENVEGAGDAPDCALWWEDMRRYMLLRPTMDDYLQEKEALIHPTQLAPPVDDQSVLHYMRTYPTTLVDRARVWVATRADMTLSVTEGEL